METLRVYPRSKTSLSLLSDGFFGSSRSTGCILKIEKLYKRKFVWQTPWAILYKFSKSSKTPKEIQPKLHRIVFSRSVDWSRFDHPGAGFGHQSRKEQKGSWLNLNEKSRNFAYSISQNECELFEFEQIESIHIKCGNTLSYCHTVSHSESHN